MYSKEFLRPKTERLDQKLISNLKEKYENEEDDEEFVEVKKMAKDDIDMKYNMDDEKAEEDIQREICLPSIKDSKLWRIKVTPGRERELVFKITNKLIEYLNAGDPLNVLEVFESSLCQGIIYCEAYKSQHVEKVLQGLSGINHRSVTMIPINEMTEVMKGCRVVQKQRFQVHQWVRIKGGIYKDDLGLIEMVDGNRRAMVRLIPRIPDDFYEDATKNFSSLRSYHTSPFIRIPQLLFNPLRVKNECQRELYRPL